MEAKTWIPGASLRLSRLFDSGTGHAVIVAMDHSFGGAHKGFERPGETIRQVLQGVPDGVLVTPGTARRFQSAFAGRASPALIVSLDYVLFHPFPNSSDRIEEQGLATSVQEAIRLGADAIKLLMIFGRDDPSMQARNFDTIGRLVEQCHTWGMPVIIEPTTWGHRFDRTNQKNDPFVLRDMARIAFEFGADVVKSGYPADPAQFHEIASSCPVPLLVLGGSKRADDAALLDEVSVLMKAGASGVTFGRNVWQHKDPAGFIRALKEVIY